VTFYFKWGKHGYNDFVPHPPSKPGGVAESTLTEDADYSGASLGFLNPLMTSEEEL